MTEREWDFRLFNATQKLIQEFKIQWDGVSSITSDDDLLDNIYAAAVQLICNVGGYCLETHRVLQFNEVEARDALKAAPSSLLIGKGRDARTIIHRDIEDPRLPNMLGRGMAPFTEGDLYIKFTKAVAELPFVDGFLSPNLWTIKGREITTLAHEIHASKQCLTWAKEGVKRAGRPGLFIGYYPISTNPATMIAALDSQFGVTETDGIFITPMPDLKIERNLLGVTRATIDHGCHVLSQPSATLGGFPGGPEGTAIVIVANSILSVLTYRSQILCGPSIVALKTSLRNTPMALWTVTSAIQTLNRNTHLIVGGVMGSLLGNIVTEMSLYEAMHRNLVLVPCGSMILGTRPYKPLQLNMCTPLEVQWAYECGVAATRFKREEANEMAQKIYKKYSNQVDNPPRGQALTECYNTMTMTPNPEYLALYQQVKKDLNNMGFDFLH